ncbi:ABC transporter permease [Flavobacterium sp. FlaQc-48]|uniref:ABC transporter permease n=1 Tax=Flavobacterium sp. FlaQc-48 TaxID=3374181 RepID=UPI0037567D4C
MFTVEEKTDLPIIIVDQDRSELSSKAIQMFEDNEVLSIASILYDQNKLSQIAIQKEATCVVIMSFGIWFIYWLFTLWFRLPFYKNLLPLTFIAGIFVLSVSFIGILVSILVPSQLKATEILMVIATPSFILSGFTWPLSHMPQAVQAIANVIPLTHFLKAFRILIIVNGTFSQTTKPVWNMVIIRIVCFMAAYTSLYFKKKSVLKEA